MFFMPQHSYQTILEITLDDTDMRTFRKIRKDSQNILKILVIMCTEWVQTSHILKKAPSFQQ